ncbi:MAG: hypothetical protein ACLQL2_01560, partial [Methylovirgula sp.]
TPIYALHGRADTEDPEFSAFLQIHEAALAAAATAAPDAAAKICAAQEHPYGEAYALFYSRLGLDIPAFLPRAV